MDWLSAHEYWLARLVLQRGIGLVYLVAFVVAVNQFRPLLGEHGLLPVPGYLGRVRFRDAPSIFHVHYSDRFLQATVWAGVALSTGVMLGIPERGPAAVSMLVWLVLWGLYLSIVNVGQAFYSFGWESLLLEAGFLAIFLGPSNSAPPVLVIWLFRWLVFRLEFGAGLIKMRGDRCWRDLTCLYYHHETQPMPNPLSWFFHHLPRPLHRVEVAANHLAQLVVPFGLAAPQPVAGLAGVVIVVTQAWLLVSGNFSWLNAITMVLAFSAFDDRLLDGVLPVSPPGHPAAAAGWHQALVIALAVLVAALSWWPVRNLLSSSQLMNASFNRLRLVNTYGAFGNITRRRNEVILEGTVESRLTPATVWSEYEFKGKPGDPRRMPPQVAPYHLRLDWLMWFAALSHGYARDWLPALARKLLENDPATLKLLRGNPFAGAPPTYVRARLYHYRFTTWEERRATGAWWVRTWAGEYLAPIGRAGSRRAGA
jgi:hypothetical protein